MEEGVFMPQRLPFLTRGNEDEEEEEEEEEEDDDDDPQIDWILG